MHAKKKNRILLSTLLNILLFKYICILNLTSIVQSTNIIIHFVRFPVQPKIQQTAVFLKKVFGYNHCNFDLSHPGWLGLSKSLEVWNFAAAELSKRQTEAESYFISIGRCVMSHAPYR